MQLIYLKLKCNRTSKAINMKNEMWSVNKLISLYQDFQPVHWHREEICNNPVVL